MLLLEVDKVGEREALGVLQKPTNSRGIGIKAARSAAQTSATVLGSLLCSISCQSATQGCSSQALRSCRLGNGCTNWHRRWMALCTLFSIWPFYQPDSGLQNSASKRKLLSMAATRNSRTNSACSRGGPYPLKPRRQFRWRYSYMLRPWRILCWRERARVRL